MKLDLDFLKNNTTFTKEWLKSEIDGKKSSTPKLWKEIKYYKKMERNGENKMEITNEQMEKIWAKIDKIKARMENGQVYSEEEEKSYRQLLFDYNTGRFDIICKWYNF